MKPTAARGRTDLRLDATLRLFFVLLAGLAAVCGMSRIARAEVDPAVLKAEAERIAVMAKAREAALAIFSNGGQGGGSGVVISPDGYALSNFHVTKGCGDAMKCGMAHGGLYDAVIVGIDPVGDLALIKLFGRDDFPYAEFGDSDAVNVGDWAFCVGNPFLLATDFQPTITYGIISGVHRYQYPAGTLLEYADCLQTDASINPGNSGGPLFDMQGRLIGINGRGSFEKRGRVNVGVGYAISINQIKNFLGCMKSGRILDHATLGARLASQDDGSVIVADILEDSDAYRRGLRYGDEVVRFGGRPIRTVNAFKNVLGIYPKGWQVPLTYVRKGKTYETLVRLSGVHGTQELIDKVNGRAPVEPPEQPPGKPEEKPGDDRENKPVPLPRAQEQAAAQEMPEVAKQHFEAHRGFANYYFNRLNRTRVWNMLVARGDFSPLRGQWALKGELLGAGDAEFRITDQSAECALPGGELKLAVGDSLTAASDPPASGGLLAALYLWRRMLALGPEKFGAVEYYGTAPLAGQPGLVEVLTATYGGVDCQFLVEPTSGRLLAVEMFLRPDDDPCELYFADYREIEGRELPSRLEVRYGDNIYGIFKLKDISFQTAPAKAPATQSQPASEEKEAGD